MLDGDLHCIILYSIEKIIDSVVGLLVRSFVLRYNNI